MEILCGDDSVGGFATVYCGLLPDREESVSIPIKENIGKGTLTGIVTGALWIGAASSILLISKQLEITGKK